MPASLKFACLLLLGEGRSKSPDTVLKHAGESRNIKGNIKACSLLARTGIFHDLSRQETWNEYIYI